MKFDVKTAKAFGLYHNPWLGYVIPMEDYYDFKDGRLFLTVNEWFVPDKKKGFDCPIIDHVIFKDDEDWEFDKVIPTKDEGYKADDLNCRTVMLMRLCNLVRYTWRCEWEDGFDRLTPECITTGLFAYMCIHNEWAYSYIEGPFDPINLDTSFKRLRGYLKAFYGANNVEIDYVYRNTEEVNELDVEKAEWDDYFDQKDEDEAG